MSTREDGKHGNGLALNRTSARFTFSTCSYAAQAAVGDPEARGRPDPAEPLQNGAAGDHEG